MAMPKDKRKGKREPRTPTLAPLPPTFAEAEEAEIIATLERWFPRIADNLTSEFGHETMRDDILRQLEQGAGASLPVAYIVAMADANHPAADHALRAYIHAAIDADRFNDMPLQVRAYAQRALTRPPLPPGYPSNQAQVVNDRTRDIGIAVLINQVVSRWPHVPKLYSSQTRHSAAWMVALVFTRHGIKLAEQQARRIHKACETLPRRLAEFLIADLPID
jgi:hypothetical protein